MVHGWDAYAPVLDATTMVTKKLVCIFVHGFHLGSFKLSNEHVNYADIWVRNVALFPLTVAITFLIVMECVLVRYREVKNKTSF